MMSNFQSVKSALEYIDDHLDSPISLDGLAERFHFSAFYFHRMFSSIVGKSIAAHIRDRRLLHACVQLAQGDAPILEIALDCGYRSAQSFSRAFKAHYGLTPCDYRAEGSIPPVVTVDEMIMKFTNRLHGGVDVHPRIIKRGPLAIAGVSGDGDKTWDVWNSFEKLIVEEPLPDLSRKHGYEIRLYDGSSCTVHVGYAVSSGVTDPSYTVFHLPPAHYAAFDVYVSNGYDSENNAMTDWLANNRDRYGEKLLDGKHYCVEYYDERFRGEEAGSIVEIWVPIEKKPVEQTS